VRYKQHSINTKKSDGFAERVLKIIASYKGVSHKMTGHSKNAKRLGSQPSPLWSITSISWLSLTLDTDADA